MVHVTLAEQKACLACVGQPGDDVDRVGYTRRRMAAEQILGLESFRDLTHSKHNSKFTPGMTLLVSC